MTREEAIQWLKVINTKEFGWDEFALQESQREIRERCEQGVREAIDMAIEALSKPNYETDTEARLAVTNRKKEKVILWDAFGEVEYYPIDVVRCKDCRWFKQDSSPVGYGYCDGRMVGREVDYNDYCSYGERQCNYFGERREE